MQFAKIYQPVVIEVDLAEIPFYKHIPKGLKIYNPMLMAKLLEKLLKSFKKTDQVIIIGNAVEPWKTSAKKLVYILCYLSNKSKEIYSYYYPMEIALYIYLLKCY